MRQGPGSRIRCAASRRCTARAATCSTSPHRLDRAESVDRQPARVPRRRANVADGNFHGQPVASRSSARRWRSRRWEHQRAAGRALGQPEPVGGLPAFLTGDSGLNSGFMIPQYAAASLVSENKVLAHPASVELFGNEQVAQRLISTCGVVVALDDPKSPAINTEVRND